MLTACNGPPVKTAAVPDVTPPATWRTDAGPTMPLDTAWWRQFGDPVLTALVEKALANNTDINVAISRVRAARANVQLARAALLPTLDFNAGGVRSTSVGPFGEPLHQSGGQFEVEAAWEVDLFGRLSDQRSAARDAYLASEAARDATRLSIAGSTASGYITLLSLDAQLKIAHQTLAARKDSLRLAKRQFDEGYSSKLELQQAQAEYESTEQLIPSTELAIARTENALSLLTDETPAAIERGGIFDALAEPSIPAGLPSSLLRRRPDVAEAEYQLAAADKSLLVARKNFLPQVQLSTALGRSFSTAQIDPITIWSLGGSILAPLFEGGRLTAEAEKAGAQRDQAAFAYRGTVLTAFREVEDALASAKDYDEQLTLVKAQRDTLVETLRIATNRYREGYTTYLDQLDAQRNLLSAQLSVVQIRASALSSRVQLYQAMGGGWSADSIDQAKAE
ncbi:efflux transporter outer membrane subunit [Paraburkholderia sp.]|uniref:efflux transporter outer membrane subunit n=1 Tax=Paraburkholderia sp. TaxID=1926495 RepID=UPI003D6EAC04